jgi:hypothetical protein
MKTKIINLEDKIKILVTSNKSEIVEYYESIIEKIHEEQKISKVLKHYFEKQNLKDLMSVLIERNEEMNNEIQKYKKCERFAIVYKNLVDKAGHQLQKNKK